MVIVFRSCNLKPRGIFKQCCFLVCECSLSIFWCKQYIKRCVSDCLVLHEKMRHILRCGSFLPGNWAVLSQAQKWLVSASTTPPLNRFLILESGQMTEKGNFPLSCCLCKVFRRLKMFSANRYVQQHYEKENLLCVAQL